MNFKKLENIKKCLSDFIRNQIKLEQKTL